jgi:hypothetical protein
MLRKNVPPTENQRPQHGSKRRSNDRRSGEEKFENRLFDFVYFKN